LTLKLNDGNACIKSLYRLFAASCMLHEVKRNGAIHACLYYSNGWGSTRKKWGPFPLKNEWTVLEINNLQYLYCTSLTFNRKTYFSQFLWDGLSRTATPATWFFSPDHVVEATQDEDVSGLVEVADVADLSKAVRVEKFWCFFLFAKIFLEKMFQLLLSQNICSSFSEMLRQFFLHLLELRRPEILMFSN